MAALQQHKIVIIGAGIGGLSTALALTQAGFNVTVYEQSNELAEVGAGIQLSSNATRILKQFGIIQPAKKLGFMPKALKISDWRSGDQIGRFPINHNGNYKDQPYLHIHRADIHHLLLEAFTALNPQGVITSAQLQAITFNPETELTTLTFNKAGEVVTVDAHWVIGADGIHSKVREYVAPDSKARFTGNVAWRGLVPVDKLSANFRPDPCANVMMGPGKHFVYYYVRGGQLVNYVAVVETDQWQEESWTIKANLEEMLDDFSGWNAQTRKILANTAPDSCYRWALHDRDPLKNWVKDRCVLLGDAAHPMLPFLAQGAAMAIEDAYVLADCFKRYSNELHIAAKEFVKQRIARTTKVQLEARKNAHIYHIRNPIIQFVRNQYLSYRSKTNPEFFNQRLSWLYDYKPFI